MDKLLVFLSRSKCYAFWLLSKSWSYVFSAFCNIYNNKVILLNCLKRLSYKYFNLNQALLLIVALNAETADTLD